MNNIKKQKNNNNKFNNYKKIYVNYKNKISI